MSTPNIISLGAGRPGCAGIAAIASGAKAEVATEAQERMLQSHAFGIRLIERAFPIYGLTTGCGPLAAHGVEPATREAFQRNLIRSHANSLGTPLPAELVRAAMAVRAHVLAKGFSAVDPHCVAVLVAMLNAGVLPIVREIGGCGASGDLVELAQIALATLGEGDVQVDGTVKSAATAFAAASITPLVPTGREGLALMNGTSFHTGAAAVLLQRLQSTFAAAEAAASLVFEALHGQSEAYAAELQNARGHQGQQEVAARMSESFTGSRLVRLGNSAAAQDAYTIRCVPQILGAVADAIRAAGGTVENELEGISDNPLFLAEEERVIHGGNFHGQPVAIAIDQLKIAAVEIGVLCERQIARVLDAQLNAGLPPFLVHGTPGLESGFMGLQYCATQIAAENQILVAPASVRSIPTNANNQDVVSMAMVGARHLYRIVENLQRMVAIELLCGAQALELRGADSAGTGTRAIYKRVRAVSDAVKVDRPLAADVEAVRLKIEAGEFRSLEPTAQR